MGTDFWMEGQAAICGLPIETECPTIEIKPIPALDFQLVFIDNLADILTLSIKPKITVSLFVPIESISEQAVISPVDISNLHQQVQSRIFVVKVDLYSNNSVIGTAYANILAMVKIIINAMAVLNLRLGLMYTARLSVANSGQASLLLTITKTA